MFNLGKEEVVKKNNQIIVLLILASLLVIGFFVYLFIDYEVGYKYIVGQGFIASTDDIVTCIFLNIMAYLGCLIYYIGNEKDEYFIISLIYLNLLIGIIYERIFGIENLGIINAILRALILISILYINRIKSLIASGKKIIVSNLVIGFTIINISIERYLINRYRAMGYRNLIIIAIILSVIISFIAIIILARNAIKNLDVLYSYVLTSISLLVSRKFIIIYGIFNFPTENNLGILKLYMGLTKFSFLFIVCGVFMQVLLKTKENVQLSSELKIFYKLAEFNYSEQIALFDSNGELCYANKKFRESISKSQDELKQYDDIRRSLYEGGYSVLGLIKLLNENTDIKKVLEVENIDRVFEVYGQKIYTPNNKIYYAFKFNDITEEYRKNQETKNNEKILSDIIDDIQEMIIALDKDGNIIFLNLTAKKYIGDIDFKQKKINYASLVSNPDQRENFEAKINEKIRYSISIDEGKTIEIESITLKIKDKEISKVDKIILARNPGESNKYNNLLLEYDKFKEHERIKNNFIINLSHEFITPINVIFSVIQLLENVDISDKDQLVSIYIKYKKPVKVNCLRIYRTINNIIDTLRLDYENIEMNFKNINIVELVEEIVIYIAKYSNNINIIFDTEFEEKIVSCDPSKIVKVITNILANAIKFSPNNSEIHINIKCEDSMIIIECIDNGIGISEEMIENIFEPFLQVDNSLRRASEGSGMGLSIAKKLIELHNGSISVESKLGIGSIFRIILPDNCLESSHDNISKIYEVNSKEIDAELSDIYNLY